MELIVISHKPCWRSEKSVKDYVTDGGFPLQMETLSHLFDSTRLLVPLIHGRIPRGVSPLCGKSLKVEPLNPIVGIGLIRRFRLVKWVIREFSMEHAKELLSEVLKMDDPVEIRLHMENALEQAGLGGLIRAGL